MIVSALLFSLMFSSATPTPVACTDMPNAVLSGVVTDQAGNAIAGAEIRLINSETGATVSVRTNESGQYQFKTADASADYTVAVRSIGFVPETRESLRVGTCDAAEMSFALATVQVPMTHTMRGAGRVGK